MTSFEKLFKFIVTEGCNDRTEAVAKAYLECAKKLILEQGPLYSNKILNILEAFIKSNDVSEQSKNTSVILIAALASFLEGQSQKKLIETLSNMINLLHNQSETVRKSVCKCIP